MQENNKTIANGVMLNAYPDSIGGKFSDTVDMLKMTEFKDVFSLLYVLPTFFNSDLDRGFSIIDYNLNKELVDTNDLLELEELNVKLKFDIVLNHLSVASPQFKDLLKYGNESKYKDFFINWNEFWEGNGVKNEDGVIIPKAEYLHKLFMRKSGLPVLKVRFPDGTEQPYWNTFYQQITYNPITVLDLQNISGLSEEQSLFITAKINEAIAKDQDFTTVDFKEVSLFKADILQVIEQKRSYLGQMDVNAASPLVWDFYEETLKKLRGYGCNILRLDAFAYLHKQVGESNFFNKPGTWEYLERIKQIAQRNDLILLPEIHAEYGLHLHDEVANEGYTIYDFFLPGLTIHTIENKTSKALLSWAKEIIAKGYKTVNMLGCHDGIPVLDLKGKDVNGVYNQGLLEDDEIEGIMNTIMERGGRVKNLYDPSGKKISYYQVNATFFSALGEDEQKLLLARAIQMFMPGIPQVWYLDVFAGKNNYEAADNGGSAGHKEINRTALTMQDIEQGLKTDVVKKQLEIIRLRNTSDAFLGKVEINDALDDALDIKWTNNKSVAHLIADLKTCHFTIDQIDKGTTKKMSF
ncbi:alpha-amylase family glycosyl hydrolase [Flavobacterium frigoris]|uniref:Maltooligosyl trehalose synthase n=1 Tax=Flavobacterium frigoris TaxID=229204 RepID=A0A1H9G643_FLAFI|nr:glycosidase [Flavobacterium frigoris]SEQ45248.1 maltooligosyl trehalose synthase [Flavobacterium frigoris]